MENAGKINQYVCEKGHRTTTVNADDGTTPFMILCMHKEGPQAQGCGGKAFSQFYRVDQSLTPEMEWYRPTPEKTRKMSPGMRHHVERGGLLLRGITGREREISTQYPKSGQPTKRFALSKLPKSILRSRKSRSARQGR